MEKEMRIECTIGRVDTIMKFVKKTEDHEKLKTYMIGYVCNYKNKEKFVTLPPVGSLMKVGGEFLKRKLMFKSREKMDEKIRKWLWTALYVTLSIISKCSKGLAVNLHVTVERSIYLTLQRHIF